MALAWRSQRDPSLPSLAAQEARREPAGAPPTSQIDNGTAVFALPARGLRLGPLPACVGVWHLCMQETHCPSVGVRVPQARGLRLGLLPYDEFPRIGAWRAVQPTAAIHHLVQARDTYGST